MKALESSKNQNNTKTTSGETYTADSAQFLMEAALNMYAVKKIDSAEVDTRTFIISAPISSAGLIDEADVSNTFWAIRDSLMELYNAITASNKELEFLEITHQVAAPLVQFKITGAISKGVITGAGCPYDFSSHHAANRAFIIRGTNGTSTTSASGTYYYGYGQGDFVNGHVVNKVSSTNNPDAPTLLRRFGISNYKNCSIQTAYTCGYYVDISTQETTTGTTLSSPTADFVANSIPTYNNSDIFNSFIFWDDCGTFATSISDAYLDYKEYLNTPMMDFYLARIPSYISNYVGSTYSFYDFNIRYLDCLCYPDHYNNDPLAPCGKAISYAYYVTKAQFVTYPCNNWIGIKSL